MHHVQRNILIDGMCCPPCVALPAAARYYLQGDKSMDTRDNLLKRNALRLDTRVKRAVQMMWDMFPKTPEFQVQKKDYIAFLVRVVKLVIPEFDAKEARATAEVGVTCFPWVLRPPPPPPLPGSHPPHPTPPSACRTA
jgi:hypothetical protein